jgi:hypothetical protein
MFAERLSVWKAREKAALGKGKRKAPPPMPFKAKNVRPEPSTRTTSTVKTNSAPVAKRPRVGPSTSEQGRGGKENEPSQRSAPVAKEPRSKAKAVSEKPIMKMVTGRVAEEMEKRMKEKLEWSERQKKREEEVKKKKELERVEEAVSLSCRISLRASMLTVALSRIKEQERKKLQALRASLTVDRRNAPSRPAAIGVGAGRKPR